MNTKIFHANADIETNRYASELIGDIYYEESTRSTTVAGQFSASQNKSVKIDRAVRPEDFARLKTGGKSNDSRVEGYLHLQGTTLKEGIDTKNHAKVTFNQNYIPHDKIDTT